MVERLLERVHDSFPELLVGGLSTPTAHANHRCLRAAPTYRLLCGYRPQPVAEQAVLWELRPQRTLTHILNSMYTEKLGARRKINMEMPFA